MINLCCIAYGLDDVEGQTIRAVLTWLELGMLLRPGEESAFLRNVP